MFRDVYACLKLIVIADGDPMPLMITVALTVLNWYLIMSGFFVLFRLSSHIGCLVVLATIFLSLLDVLSRGVLLIFVVLRAMYAVHAVICIL